MERPTLGWNDVLWGNIKIDRSVRRIGCQGHRKAIQRYRETLATGFEVSLLLGPTTEKGFGVEMARDGSQIVDFGC